MKSGQRHLTWVAVAGSAALIATACTPGGDDGGDGGDGDGGPVELVFALGGAEAQTGGVHQRVADLFNESHDDIQVTIETLPEDADSQREQLALELQAEGSGFDLLGLDVIWTGEFQENGWLESVEDLRGDLEGKIADGPLESAVWGGELWAVPYNSNVGFLYYRSDLVDEAPTTWEELCTAAEDVGGAEDMAGFVGQGAQYEGFVVNWLEYYWSAGGTIYNEDQSEVTFDVDIATEVTQFMADSMGSCFAPGFNTAQEEEARNEFQQGNAVFMRNWPYATGLIDEDNQSPANGNYEIAPLPTFSGEGTISALGGFNIGISAFSENKEEAKEFALWASTNEEAQALVAEGPPPVLLSVYEEFQDDPVLSLIGEVLPDAKARPAAPEYPAISDAMQQNLFPAYNGEGDPREAAEAVREFLEGTIS